MERSSVLSKIDSGAGYVLLNRPEHLNAFDLDLGRQFLHVIAVFRKDKTVRAVVIKGAGRVFSAGGDVKEMQNIVREKKDRTAFFRSPLATFNKMILAIKAIPKPVLAAVHGAVAGVAFSLMLACDLRIAEEKTVFSQAFINIGLSPDGGGTYFLPRLVGHARACELTMLPTKIDAKTALDWGLINWVVPATTFEEEVRKTAERLANSPALAMSRTKSLLHQTYERSLSEQMEAERLAQVENAESTDFEEGLRAFIERRQPRFRAR